MPENKILPCAMIEATSATQVRKKLNKDVIELYMQDILDGAKMPAVVAFAEAGSSRYVLADGFHRLLATVNAEIDEIEVDVYEGGMHEALEYALSANRAHGLRRSNADKIHAVEMALKDPAFSKLLQTEIADLCGVSVSTVSRVGLRDTIGTNTSKTFDGPEENKPTNNRPTKIPPSQIEIERDEVRQALSIIKALPYPGDQAIKLGFSPDDIADMEYVSTWLAHCVIETRNGDVN